jgi:hypothetical protein
MGAQRTWPNTSNANRGKFNPKTEIEPRITRIDTDDEEVVKTISKPDWCILKSVKSVKSVVKRSSLPFKNQKSKVNIPQSAISSLPTAPFSLGTSHSSPQSSLPLITAH